MLKELAAAGSVSDQTSNLKTAFMTALFKGLVKYDDTLGAQKLVEAKKLVWAITGYSSTAADNDKNNVRAAVPLIEGKLNAMSYACSSFLQLTTSTDKYTAFQKIDENVGSLRDAAAEILRILGQLQDAFNQYVPSVVLSGTSIEGGKVLLSWTTNVNVTKDTKLVLSVTDTAIGTAATNAIVKVPIDPIEYTKSNGDVVYKSSYTVDNLILGTNYLFQLLIDKANSNSLKIKSQTIPARPIISFIARDNGAAFKIMNAGAKNSSWDGYSQLTGVEVSVADGINMTTIMLPVLSLNEEDLYTTSVTIPSDAVVLKNETPYEIAVRTQNAMGFSQLSSTVVGTPKDTPNQVSAILALSDATFLSFSNDLVANATGAVYTFFKRPDDYQSLNKKNSLTGVNEGTLRITSFTLVREQMQKVLVSTTTNGVTTQTWNGDWEVKPGSVPVSITKTLPSKDAEDPYLVTNTLGSVVYDYMFVDTNTVIGEKYEYSVLFANANGDGEVSKPSNIVSSLKIPLAPTVTSVYGDKSVKVTLVSGGSLHGGETPASNEFWSEVKDDGNGWISSAFEFDKVVSSGNPPNVVLNPNFNTKTFTSTANGVILQVKIYTQTLDNYAPGFVTSAQKTFRSLPVALSGLTYTSPNAPAAVAVYAIDSEYKPITLNGSPAVAVVFKPWGSNNLSKFGGLQNQTGFNPTTDVRYLSYTNSSLNQAIAPIYSQPFSAISDATEYSFIVPSPLNTNPSHYVRMAVLNKATGEWNVSQELNTTSIWFF
jgi:hypothetical protein